MRITNARLLVGHEFVPGSIEFNEQFTAVGQVPAGTATNVNGAYIVPGLIDVHTHAAVGEDASDGSVNGLIKLARYYAKKGVTSWLPTTMTLQEPELTAAMHAFRNFIRPADGAKAVGVHLEGPFLCYAKRGAQAAENLHKPDINMLMRLQEASGNMIRMVTVAPEEDEGLAFIKEASRHFTISLGHTTANYDTAMKAFQAGASHATHLFNAMPSLHHREPGVIGAALDAGASVELICDGLHIHPSVIRLAHKTFSDKVVLISDSLRCAGMPDGEYTLGGQPIELKNGKATLKDSDTLAGSAIHLYDAVMNAIRYGFRPEDAFYAASTAPAKAIRLDDSIGSIAVGKYADFLILNEDLSIRDVYINGQKL